MMFTKLMKVLVLGLILALGTSTVALADVPDPSGRPRPRPRREWYEYTVYRENINQDSNNFSVEVFYTAPRMSEITYKLVDAEGNVLQEGVDVCPKDKDEGSFVVPMPKPAKGDSCVVSLNTICSLSTVKTAFGYKIVDKPVFVQNYDVKYKIAYNDAGNVTINLATD